MVVHGMMMGGSEEGGWRKGPWTPEEDKLLTQYINLHGEGRWSSVARSSGLKRSGKSCRLRWVNYLRPGLKRGHLSPQEEGIIIELHALWGNKWSTIARYLPGRTDNEIKNYWRTHFKKKAKPASSEKIIKTALISSTKHQNHQQGQETGTPPGSSSSAKVVTISPDDDDEPQSDGQHSSTTDQQHGGHLQQAIPNASTHPDIGNSGFDDELEAWGTSWDTNISMDYGSWGWLWNYFDDQVN